MELKRRIALSAVLVAAGLATGHFVQSRAQSGQPVTADAGGAALPTPQAITPVAAGTNDLTAPAASPTAEAPLNLPPQATATTAPQGGEATEGARPAMTASWAENAADLPLDRAELPMADATNLTLPLAAPPIVALPRMAVQLAARDPAVDGGVPATPGLPLSSQATATDPVVPSTDASATVADASCPVTLDLAAQENAMIGLTLTAPCRAGERVVIRHGGLAYTAQSTATGALFTSLPALETSAMVTVLFGDGELAEATIEVPEAAEFRRFGVQWLADDAFQLHAFEGGADYGMPGHVSAQDPRAPLPGVPRSGGFLTRLGDPASDLPMLAEVYTWPADASVPVEVVIETAVTEGTCGRDLLGETLTSVGGETYVTDLTLAMPACDATGDILVLKNLVPDLKLAAAGQ